MLEAAVGEGGTGALAAHRRLPGGGQDRHRAAVRRECRGYCGYTATFAGFAPADAPRLVVLAVIQDPQGRATTGARSPPRCSRKS